jgi:hypothetical protein
MSTRATYEFSNSDKFIPTITYYIHHDGYPEGAAWYFANMLECSQAKNEEYSFRSKYSGGLCESFLHGNNNAEFTESHKAHGDTEYRYNVDNKGNLIALKKIYKDESVGAYATSWTQFFVGTVEKFVEDYKKD